MQAQAIEVIKNSTFENNILMLPPQQLDRPLYVAVNKKLQGIGGKWNRKAKGFLFEHEAAKLLEEVRNGAEINLKKEFQFFATPAELADRVVAYASIEPNHQVLEPSAGKGALCEAVIRRGCKNTVTCYEKMEQNQPDLAKVGNAVLIGNDFLCAPNLEVYDRIIANPPFTKNQDIDHIRKMFAVCKSGGRIVTIASKSWTFGSQKKQVEFREWLDELNAEVTDIDWGEFKESGTMVATVMVIIDKP